jgi:hypothetical protein
MNNFLDIVKYLVYGMIVYVLFSYVPQNKLPLTDVLVITIVIMMTYMLLDFLAPYNNIENLDPDYIDEPEFLDAKENNSKFSNLASVNGIGNLDDMNDSDIDKNDAFEINNSDNNIDETKMVAEILVNSGLPSSEIDELLLLCETDKKVCNDKLKKMKVDGILNDSQLNMLTNNLINKNSDLGSINNTPSIKLEDKNELKAFEEANIQDDDDDNNEDEDVNNEDVDVDNEDEDVDVDVDVDNEEINNKYQSERDSKGNQNNPPKNQESQKVLSKKQEKSQKIISSLKKLLPNISDNELININNICKNKDQCRNKINELVVSGSLSNEEKLKLSIMYGLDEYSELGELFNTKKLNSNQIIEIGNVCNKNIPSSMCNSVLNKYTENGILNQDQVDNILINTQSFQSGNLQDNELVNELLQTGNFTSNESAKVHQGCSLNNSQNCVQVLKQIKDNGKITELQMKQILKSYKMDTVQISNTNFGSISNESELGSVNKSEKLSSLNDAFGSSDMKYSQLDPEMHKPLGEFSSDFNNTFEYGYAYLNTSKWRVPMYKPPVCKSEDHCKVCPTNTQGYPVDVKEWNRSRKIMPPDNINIEYLNKLNKGN